MWFKHYYYQGLKDLLCKS